MRAAPRAPPAALTARARSAAPAPPAVPCSHCVLARRRYADAAGPARRSHPRVRSSRDRAASLPLLARLSRPATSVLVVATRSRVRARGADGLLLGAMFTVTQVTAPGAAHSV